MKTFSEYLNERKKNISDDLIFKDSIWVKIKNAITMNWVEPLSMNKKHGTKYLIDRGYTKQEVDLLRKQLKTVMKKAFDKFKWGDHIRVYDDNFSGYMIDSDEGFAHRNNEINAFIVTELKKMNK